MEKNSASGIVNEQPFTRSQSNIIIPSNTNTVTVRSHDLISGWGGKSIIINLNQSTGSNFEVQKIDNG